MQNPNTLKSNAVLKFVEEMIHQQEIRRREIQSLFIVELKQPLKIPPFGKLYIFSIVLPDRTGHC